METCCHPALPTEYLFKLVTSSADDTKQLQTFVLHVSTVTLFTTIEREDYTCVYSIQPDLAAMHTSWLFYEFVHNPAGCKQRGGEHKTAGSRYVCVYVATTTMH